MTEKNKEQLSRRDALKVLGAAAGATALANLPNKWHSPELLSGVLPAHAQTSTPVCVDYALTVEVLSLEGSYRLNLTFAPDEIEGNILRFYCQSGCLLIAFRFSGETTGSLRLTTIAHQFNLDLVPDVTRYALINLGTGEYGLDMETTPEGCNWDDLLPRQSQPDRTLEYILHP